MEVHNTHEVISLVEKGEYLKETLRTSLDRMKIGSELIKLIKQLEQKRTKVELSAKEASEQMKQHHRNVTSKLSEILHKQHNVIDNQKRKQMREIDEEERTIYDIVQRMEIRKEDISNHLRQPVSSKFIQQCKEDLAWAESYHSKWKGPTTMWKQSVFVLPEAPPVDSSEYLDHCERFIIGYFAFVCEDMEERRNEESVEKRNKEETRIYNTPSNAQNDRPFDSVSVDSTLDYNDPDEYATQYTASYAGRSVTSQKDLHSNLYEDMSSIVSRENNGKGIYEEVEVNPSSPPNEPHERPTPSSCEYVRHRNEAEQLPPASAQNVPSEYVNYRNGAAQLLPEPARNVSSPRKLPKLSKDLISIKDRRVFHLRIISDVAIKEFSMWLCGWSRNVVGKNVTVLMSIDSISLAAQFKTKRTNRDANLPTILAPFKDCLLFTKKGGNKVYSYSESKHSITKVCDNDSFRIKAMCCTDEHIYIMDTKSYPCVRVFNTDFQLGTSTSLDQDTRSCDMDMCVVENTIFISTAKPVASVKALRQGQVVWQVNAYTRPQLTQDFDPCSVAASVTGDVFVADRGTDKVRFTFLLFYL